ncbi:hypothetical protein pdam_00018207 [Pocillopora damicornis]|uniref:Sulfotransferase domain-containing protein n=1 Tax=Pocillopora damicornis TaxID=46731 RepID=A0A3M6U9Q7_POCDA|nr:hypothetical protein pdam_00018207 [Pocillopora damicornis]
MKPSLELKTTTQAVNIFTLLVIPKMQQSQATNFVKSLGSSTGLNAPWKYYLRYCLLREKTMYSQWSDHVLGWWEHRRDPNVLFLKYEDLQRYVHSNYVYPQFLSG